MIAVRLAWRGRLSYITGADVRRFSPRFSPRFWAALTAIPRLRGTARTGQAAAVPISATEIADVE
jgi:hypothetical protein